MKTHNKHLIILVTLAALMLGLGNWGWGQTRYDTWSSWPPSTANTYWLSNITVHLYANNDGTFTADVELKEGYQCITIEYISSGNTVGYWTKEIYRHKDKEIVITLNGDENGVITRESEYKIAGDISNCTDVKLTVCVL